jgi:hypothetical protein
MQRLIGQAVRSSSNMKDTWQDTRQKPSIETLLVAIPIVTINTSFSVEIRVTIHIQNPYKLKVLLLKRETSTKGTKYESVFCNSLQIQYNFHFFANLLFYI